MSCLSDLGESEAIRLLTAPFTQDSSVTTGPGDDCAVVKQPDSANTELLLTSDPLIEGIHFDESATPEGIGHKAIGRVLSDIAAMGGTPAWALINITAPPTLDMGFLTAITESAAALADRYEFRIVGGDLAQSNRLELHTFGVGMVPSGEAILRSGAEPDDYIFVTGALGGSRSGKQFSFEPRINEGIFLREWASSMIDVSDGLATDLRHITKMSNAGAFITANQIPVSPTHSLEQALTDGEDFELLFTIPSSIKSSFETAWLESAIKTPISHIGQITDRPDLIEIQNEDGSIRSLDEKGYQHF
jgi:thiamine-monophosphate kinase